MEIKPKKQLFYVLGLSGVISIQFVITFILYWIHKVYFGNNLSFDLSCIIPIVIALVGYVLIIKINHKKNIINFLIAIPIISLLEFFAILLAVRLIGE